MVGLVLMSCPQSAKGQNPRYGRTYGMFGERVLGQPIRPPQPRFSQSIERTPDGVFQGIRPPGSGAYSRSETAREAREFRYREWLTPEGNFFRSTPELPSGEGVVALPNSIFPTPQPTPFPPGEGMTPEVFGTGEGAENQTTSEASAVMDGIPEGGTGEAQPGLSVAPWEMNQGTDLPPPTRWINSTRAPSQREGAFLDNATRSRRSLLPTDWREELRHYQELSDRRRVLAGPAWEAYLAERLSRILGPHQLAPIRVLIRGETAFLEGKISSQAPVDLAVRVLLLEPGIWQVVSRLEVVAAPE